MLNVIRLNALKLKPWQGSIYQKFSSGNVVVSFKDVSYEYIDNKPILDEATFTIRSGNKVTIMGQNGSGKSTIMKLINGTYQPHSGSVNRTRDVAVATALQVMPREYRELSVLDFFKKQLHGVDSGIESRIADALSTVQLVAPHDRKISSFSGGQQARLLLASALALEPDVLLLDEPTNNLDVAGIDFLTSYIQMTDQTCVVISHDEHFLNSFSDSVLYLDVHTKKVEQYNGDYNAVKADIAARIARENSANYRLQKEAQAKKDQANVFANKGGNMRKVALRMREEAEKKQAQVVDVRMEDKSLKPFTFPFEQTPGGGNVLMTINNILKPGSEATTVPMRSGPVTLNRGWRVRIRGPNGIGKTTLLEAIAKGRIPGVEVNPSVRVGYYRQDFDNLDFDATVLECLQNAAAGRANDQAIRATAGAFFLTGDKVGQIVSTLSEGQKGLVALACLVLRRPGILIMDEPTNHINFRHLPALAKALSEFQGGLILVSHDADFAKKVSIDQTIDLDYELSDEKDDVVKGKGNNKNQHTQHTQQAQGKVNKGGAKARR